MRFRVRPPHSCPDLIGQWHFYNRDEKNETTCIFTNLEATNLVFVLTNGKIFFFWSYEQKFFHCYTGPVLQFKNIVFTMTSKRYYFSIPNKIHWKIYQQYKNEWINHVQAQRQVIAHHFSFTWNKQLAVWH